MTPREQIARWDEMDVPDEERIFILSPEQARVIREHIFGDPDTKEKIGHLYGYPVEEKRPDRKK